MTNVVPLLNSLTKTINNINRSVNEPVKKITLENDIGFRNILVPSNDMVYDISYTFPNKLGNT